MAVEKLDDMETAFIDIEMDVSCLKVRRTGFPDFCIRIQPLNFFPGREANPFAVSVRADKQQIEVVVLIFVAAYALWHECSPQPLL